MLTMMRYIIRLMLRDKRYADISQDMPELEGEEGASAGASSAGEGSSKKIEEVE